VHTTIVSTDTLAAHLDDPAWVVVDCRHDLASPGAGAAQYAASHVPGAAFIHADHDMAGPKTGKNGRHPLPAIEVLAAKLGAIGVGPDTQVVAYDAQGGLMAARLWWMLRWLGHDAVAVLDGGLQRWQKEGRPVDTSAARGVATTFVPKLTLTPVDASEILRAIGKPGLLVVDARANDRYQGQNETLDPVAGHIPGARNRVFRDNLAADFSFKPAATLREEWTAFLGAQTPDSVVHSCGSGVSACHNMLALAIAGLPTGRLYPGSWSEWSSDPSRPVATGPHP
jgi:thiosulfate/3-mercaptopyruvate sulfurtransferase